MNQILYAVGNYYNVSPNEILKVTRKREIAQKRMMFIYLCFVKIPGLQLKQVQYFIDENGRNEIMNHASIIHSRKVIESLISFNPITKHEAEQIMFSLAGKITFIPNDVYLLGLCQTKFKM